MLYDVAKTDIQSPLTISTAVLFTLGFGRHSAIFALKLAIDLPHRLLPTNSSQLRRPNRNRVCPDAAFQTDRIGRIYSIAAIYEYLFTQNSLMISRNVAMNLSASSDREVLLERHKLTR